LGWAGFVDSVISVIIPAKNESPRIARVVAAVRAVLPAAEVIVVDDGSGDDTAARAVDAGAQVVSHPVSMGNGAAIKTGARRANGDVLVFLDGDGQHPAESIPGLLALLDQGYEMVVGARDRRGQAGVGRSVANRSYNLIASLVTGYPDKDLTSGFRVARAARFREFLYLLPNGFSYPTTITMAFLRSAYPVAYVPVEVAPREGRSHIRPVRDGIRFLLIIFKIATLYSPLKLFVPTSGLFFLAGAGNYVNTFLRDGRFTNMSALLFSASAIIFLIGLISEQITALMFRRHD
jgi:glycosyltransferase involved in cell wall biosynthesis